MSQPPDERMLTLQPILDRLTLGMVEFMEPDEEEPDDNYDCGYEQGDIDACVVIVNGYLQSIFSLNSTDQQPILELVQDVVERLNDLNDRCDGCLIETDQREDLCELILVAARQAGMTTDDDVTETWRQW